MTTRGAGSSRSAKVQGTARRQPAGKRRTATEKAGSPFVGRFMFGRVTVSSKGWIVIPKQIRDEMGLQPGDEVSLMLSPPAPGIKQDRGLYTMYVSRVPEDPVSTFAGAFADLPGGSWTEALLKERRREQAREERADIRRKSKSA